MYRKIQKCRMWLGAVAKMLRAKPEHAPAARREPGKFDVVGLAALLTVLTLPLAVPSARAAADFESGWQAYQQGDFAGAIKIWMPLAKNGDARAQFNLGVMYDEGRGVAEDRARAMEWWQKAANAGNVHAQHNLGLAYLTGEGVEQDYQAAVSWLGDAAGKGLIRSQYSLGKIYAAGLGMVPQDDKLSFIYIEMAAKNGFDKAQYNLGKMYRDGRGVKKDVEAAAKWFLAAAEQGYAKAQRNIGTRLARGEGIEHDEVKGLMWLTLAAEAGATDAAKLRDDLRTRLSTEQRKAAEEMARNWTSKRTR